jgi:sulfonate transport system substrate-binding protein
MAAAEVESEAKLFHRNAAPTPGASSTCARPSRRRTPPSSEKSSRPTRGRAFAPRQPAELTKSLIAYTKLPEAGDPAPARAHGNHPLDHRPAQVDTILAAGLALQEAGVLPAATDVRARSMPWSIASITTAAK